MCLQMACQKMDLDILEFRQFHNRESGTQFALSGQTWKASDALASLSTTPAELKCSTSD